MPFQNLRSAENTIDLYMVNESHQNLSLIIALPTDLTKASKWHKTGNINACHEREDRNHTVNLNLL